MCGIYRDTVHVCERQRERLEALPGGETLPVKVFVRAVKIVASPETFVLAASLR